MDCRRIAVLYNQTDSLVKGQPQDLLADQGVIACAHAVAEALEAAGFVVVRVPFGGDVELALAPYAPPEWLIFNLGEGLAGKLFEEVRIAWALETMGYRMTGADAVCLALSTHKARAKEAFVRAGLATPRWRLFTDPSQTDAQELDGLSFPLFVKPVAEDASLGIGEDAMVHTLAELRARVAKLVGSYRQAALAEEFIAGREFNISIWGDPPTTLPLAEINFVDAKTAEERVVSFAAKWETDSPAFRNTPVICPAQVGPELGRRIQQAALGAWRAIGGKGYGRVDLRLDAAETPYVLEVNCNPDISPDAGFFRAAREAGYDYTGMVLHIVQMALEQTHSYDRTSHAIGR